MGFPGVSLAKNMPLSAGDEGSIPGLEDPLKEEMATHSCENWTINKAECQRSDAFKLWCWRRLLKVP